MTWKEYFINLLKDPASTISFVEETYSDKLELLLIIIGGLCLFPNFEIFQLSYGDLWVWLVLIGAMVGLLIFIFVIYQGIFFILAKLMYRGADYDFSRIRKSNIWYAASSFIVIQLIFMPIQLGILYLGDKGVGLMLYWIVVLVWYIWAIGLEFMNVQNYITDNSLKNMYLTIISHICGFGMFQILLYVGFLGMY
ncbi:MAG: hypothetical protein ACTSO9_01610 [Candidatus Helarchaeota archaeon]